MTPLRIEIVGAKGFRAGLRRESLSIDFTTIPSDAVTVAIRGDNGTGKSTLLNMMTPWREPSHIADIYAMFDNGGMRSLEFSHGDNDAVYHSIISYKISPVSKKTTATLLMNDRGVWRPYVTKDGTQSDGKTSTYDKCLEDLLGKRSIYFLSAFRHQGMPPLADHADPKGLMRDLLALGSIESLANDAKAVASGLEKKLRDLRGDIEAADSATQRLDEIPAEIGKLRAWLPDCLADVRARGDAVHDAKLVYEAARLATSDNEEAKRRREALERRLGEASARIVDACALAEQDRLRAERSVTDARRNTASSVAAVDRNINQTEGMIGECRALSKRIAEVRTAEEADKSLLGRIAEIEVEILEKAEEKKLARADSDRHGVLNVASAKIQQQILSIKADGVRLKESCADLERRKQYADDVPFGKACLDAKCKALRDAINAGERLPSETAALETRRRELDAAIVDRKGVDAERDSDALSGAPDKIRQIEMVVHNMTRGIAACNAERVRLANIIALRPSIERASSQIVPHEKTLADLKARRDEAVQDGEALITSAGESLSRVLDRLKKIKEDGETEKSSIQKEIDALPPVRVDEALIAASAALTKAEADSRVAESSLNTVNLRIDELAMEEEKIQACIAGFKKTKAMAGRIISAQSDMALLSRALLGVIDLSIEDAGPAIAATANHLLGEAYGTRFSIKIVTQKSLVTKKDELRECFEIYVIDADSGIESPILTKSGGELVWLDAAIRGAVGLYLQESSGVRYGVRFSDEADDGLTAQRSEVFFRMKRAILESGSYSREYFISHKPMAFDMADYVINLDEHKVECL